MKEMAIIQNLVVVGLKEITRDPKILFFSMIFPLFFLGLFYGMSFVIPSSEVMEMTMIEFMFPGILMMAFASIGFLGTSVPIIEMRQKGVLKTFRTTPLKENTFVLSQVIVRLVLACIQLVIFVVIGVFLNMIDMSNLLLFLVISLLGICMFLIFGFLFGGLFNHVELASGVLSFLMVPLIMLSGAMLPLYILPDVFQTISYFIPITYLTDIYHQFLFGVEGNIPIIADVLITIGISVIFYWLTVKTFKWN